MLEYIASSMGIIVKYEDAANQNATEMVSLNIVPTRIGDKILNSAAGLAQYFKQPSIYSPHVLFLLHGSECLQ